MKHKMILLPPLAAAGFFLAACEDKSPTEEAIDEVGDSVEDVAEELD